jgi:hypothetical protein
MLNVRQTQVRAKYVRVGDYCPNGGWVTDITKSTTGWGFDKRNLVTLTFYTGGEWVDCTIRDDLIVDIERIYDVLDIQVNTRA